MDTIRETNGKDWTSIFKKFPDKKEEEIILKLLKLPFLNFSSLFLLEEKQILDKMGANPETGFLDLKQAGKGIVNPLEPHVDFASLDQRAQVGPLIFQDFFETSRKTESAS